MQSLQGPRLPGKDIELPNYKFYTALILQSLDFARTYGTSSKEGMASLKQALIRDDQFERKMSQQIKGAVAQFAIVAALTWFFVFMSHALVDAPLSLLLLCTIAGLHIGGLCFFFFIYHKQKQKHFSQLGFVLSSLYQLWGALRIGIPISRSLQLASIPHFLELSDSKYTHIQDRLQTLLDNLQKKGVPVTEDLKELIDEVWFVQDEQFLIFHKNMTALKLLSIVLFFVSSYFLYLFSLISIFLH